MIKMIEQLLRALLRAQDSKIRVYQALRASKAIFPPERPVTSYGEVRRGLVAATQLARLAACLLRSTEQASELEHGKLFGMNSFAKDHPGSSALRSSGDIDDEAIKKLVECSRTAEFVCLAFQD